MMTPSDGTGRFSMRTTDPERVESIPQKKSILLGVSRALKARMKVKSISTVTGKVWSTAKVFQAMACVAPIDWTCMQAPGLPPTTRKLPAVLAVLGGRFQSSGASKVSSSDTALEPAAAGTRMAEGASVGFGTPILRE